MPSGDVFSTRECCKNGHPYTAENTRVPKGRSGRECRACGRLIAIAHSDRRKVKVFAAYGNKCAWPGCEICDPDMLMLDHVNDDGYLDRQGKDGRSRRAGGNMYAKVWKEGCPKDKYQLLCANHNQKKEMVRRHNAR